MASGLSNDTIVEYADGFRFGFREADAKVLRTYAEAHPTKTGQVFVSRGHLSDDPLEAANRYREALRDRSINSALDAVARLAEANENVSTFVLPYRGKRAFNLGVARGIRERINYPKP